MRAPTTLAFIFLAGCNLFTATETRDGPDIGSPDMPTAAFDGGVDAGADADAGCASDDEPTICASLSAECGTLAVEDNCGIQRSDVDCGTCEFGACEQNVCVCNPESDAEICDRLIRNCDAVDATDNCGADRSVDCGTCNSPATCGGGGTPGVCACSDQTDADFCDANGATCGAITAIDVCMQMRTTSCGTCTAPQTCGGAGVANECGCTPNGDADFCVSQGAQCAATTGIDNCGNTRTVAECGPCGGTGETCQAGTCLCTPESDADFCGRLGATCDSVTDMDNCGQPQTAWCGTCGVGEICQTNQCLVDPNCGNGTCDFDEIERCPQDCGMEVIGIMTGRDQSCAFRGDGTAACWGSNFRGQLGDGSNTDSNVPVPSDFTSISMAGSVRFSCSATPAGEAQCAGLGNGGQLGDGLGQNSIVPVTVVGLTGVRAVATGDLHGCALHGGNISCWGSNTKGPLGDGTGANSDSPVSVVGISTATAIAAGGEHSCAVLADGSARCWGRGISGELGNGASLTELAPTSVSGTQIWIDITAGAAHSCGVAATGELFCWGANQSGQTGTGTSSAAPTRVPQISAIQVSAGEKHTCAVLIDRTVACWGDNQGGQLGDGTALDSPTPLVVQNLNDVFRVSAGGSHTCALLRDASVRCWGQNSSGQLGDGTNTQSASPVPVVGL